MGVTFISEVTVYYQRGLPVITVPLPSRKERCRFTLRPVTSTVADFLKDLHNEDKGIDRVVIQSTGECAIMKLSYILIAV